METELERFAKLSERRSEIEAEKTQFQEIYNVILDSVLFLFRGY